mmetsp:Transcript_28801/g.84107  ORF Transcript_28801/g.84107 Transcript_28801/m.84107 type:complete len:233 (+) Transcript_28801:496-1194(+)
MLLRHLDLSRVANNDDLWVLKVLTWQVHPCTGIALDVPNVRPFSSAEPGHEIFRNLELGVHKPGVGDSAMVVLHDLLHNLLALADRGLGAGKGHFSWLGLGDVPGRFGKVHLHSKGIFDGIDGSAARADELRVVHRVHYDEALYKVRRRQRHGVPLRGKFHDRLLRRGQALGWAGDGDRNRLVGGIRRVPVVDLDPAASDLFQLVQSRSLGANDHADLPGVHRDLDQVPGGD